MRTILEISSQLTLCTFIYIDMSAPDQGQSTAKTLFLLASMACWLIVGASLIYLVPAAMDAFRPSPTTGVWMETLTRGGYSPQLAIRGGGIAFVLAVVGNVLWYQKSGDELVRKR